MIVAETARLRLRHLCPGDAPFILGLLNDPDFLRYIGDRNVRTLEDAHRYLEQGPLLGYARDGFHLNCVELRDGATPVGICGVLRRETLPHPDLGYAFLPGFRGAGLAREAASAALEDASQRLGLSRILAVTTRDNAASMRLLARLGFAPEPDVRLPGQDADHLRLFAWNR